MQKPDQSMYVAYGKINAFMKSFVQPILVDPLTEGNLKDIDDGIKAMPGENFVLHLQQCEDHSLLTLRQISGAKKQCSPMSIPLEWLFNNVIQKLNSSYNTVHFWMSAGVNSHHVTLER